MTLEVVNKRNECGAKSFADLQPGDVFRFGGLAIITLNDDIFIGVESLRAMCLLEETGEDHPESVYRFAYVFNRMVDSNPTVAKRKELPDLPSFRLGHKVPLVDARLHLYR